MASRDRLSFRPGPPADEARPEHAALPPGHRAKALMHRLRPGAPGMRLVRPEPEEVQTSMPRAEGFATTVASKPQPVSATITDPTDPRWVLALRTAESLQGTILGPEKRDRLVKIGKMMGLTAFDANLVIAIVQDQARRGYAPEYCPTAGEPQLAMVPLPRKELSDVEARTRRIGIICGVISVLVGIELVVLKWIFS